MTGKARPNPAAQILEPEFAALQVIRSINQSKAADVHELYKAIGVLASKIVNGDDEPLEAMLAGQAIALQHVFAGLMSKAANRSDFHQADVLFRLALKAQAQSAKTIQILGELRNPKSVAFVRQANIASQQIVSNGDSQHPLAQQVDSAPNQLSGETNELRPDTRAPCIEGRVDSSLETVGTINRPSDY